MSIEQTEEKINPIVEHSAFQDSTHSSNPGFLAKINPFYSLLLILVVASIFFALGRFSVLEERKGSIRIYNENGLQQISDENTSGNTASVINAVGNQESSGGEVIGSKSGKKYYFPWCGTVKRIKPENQVKFASIEEAKLAGFTAGGNCKGLE
ncbi:MAG: hypothetical protein V4690_00860 [Patescibacteria group bacterium]